MFSEGVRAEQVRTLYRQTLPVLVTSCLNTLVLSAVSWSSASRAFLLAWVGAAFALSGGRLWLASQYRRAQPAPSEARVWGVRFAAASATSGLLWGLACSYLLGGASPLSQLLLLFVLGGMCAAAAGTLACYVPAFVAFVTPALGAVALRLALYPEPTYRLMAAGVVLYATGLFLVARVNQRALSEAFVLRFENAELLARLSRTQSSLEDANRTLELRVAERSRALEEQAEALREAQRMEAIGRLAGGVAHDFNNLLTVILANISSVSTQRTPDERLRAALREARDAATKAADLVRQLLSFRRRQHTAPETFDLNTLITTLERVLSERLGAGSKLSLELAGGPLYVHMDPAQVEQIILDLILNARDAMPGGGGVTIETDVVEMLGADRGLKPGKYARLSVNDTGSGMDAATRARIFEPFFTTKPNGKGAGLGLASTYGIVQQSGGHIRVSSELGRGSCFLVYLPIASAPAHVPEESGPAPRTASGLREVTKPRGATILLVEDEPSVRSVAQRILASAGYRVLTAASAEQALALSNEHAGPIDLLVSDVVMAGIDGPALGAELSRARADLRVLFVSGYSHDHSLLPDNPNLGAGFLPKPFTYDSLLAKVAELLAAPRDASGRQPSTARGA